jgi:hypothetical protein
MSDNPDQPNERLARLWKECIAGWRNLVLGFGRPIDLARWGWMRALEHRALGYWLRPLEDLVRSFIYSDALTRDVSIAKRRRTKRADCRAKPASPAAMPRGRPTCRMDPTTWKVSFRMSKRDYDSTRPRGSRRNRKPAARRHCRGFAYRIEALRRVICNRDVYAIRYARRLARLAEANSAREPILRPARREDPPDRQAIRINTPTTCAPPASLAASMTAEHRIAPWTAKHIEPG